jgi:hypothetical protein
MSSGRISSNRMRDQQMTSLALLTAIALLAGSSVASADQRLGGGEIRKVLAGKTASWVTGNGQFSGKTSWSGTGSLNGTVLLNGNVQPFSGSWEVKGDRLCSTIAMDPRGTRCQTMSRVTRNKYHFIGDDGSLESVVTFQ